MRRSFAFAAVASLWLCGCGEQHFRAETIWHADHRVERAIYQPAEFFPVESRTGWQIVQPADPIASAAFIGSIRGLPARQTGDAPYLAAWATFPAADALPDHLRFVAADPSRFGQLKRSSRITSLGLADQFEWRETLTDVISFDDMVAARREAVGLVADLVEASLKDESPTYDVSKLLRWIRSDAAAWFEESHAACIEAAIRRTRGDQDATAALPNRLADIAARYGLNVRTPDGSLIDGGQLGETIGHFLVAKVRETVRTPEAKPIDDAAARELLRGLGMTQAESLTWNPSPAWQNAVIARFGNQEAAKAKAAELGTRLLGVYQAGFFTPKRPLHYEMTVPGEITETTGERIAGNRVVWRFDAADAFPLGYDMTVRSLAANESAQKALLGTVRLQSLEQLAEYAALTTADPALAGLMEQCIKVRSLKPLDDYETSLATKAGVEPAVLARLASLRRLITP